MSNLQAPGFNFDDIFDEVAPSKPSPIALRAYQNGAIEAVVKARADRRQRVLIVLPTGTGKTTVFSSLIGAMNCRSLVVAHRIELLEQAASRIAGMNPQSLVSIESGELKAKAGSDVVVAGVQSIGRADSQKLDWLRPEFLIIDEAHHAAAASYQNVMHRFGCYASGAFALGVTATPHRLDNKPLHGSTESIFEECVFTYTLKDAIRDSWLCDLKGYRVETSFDLERIKTVAGDFNQAELAEAINNDADTGAAIEKWQEVASDRRTIVFCAGVQHAKDVAEAFRAQDIKSEHVTGEMAKDLRKERIEAFRRGEIQVLTNCDIATEGFDCPEIDCVLLLRPTQSWALYTQMVGRGARISPGKSDCIVIDVVGNTSRHCLASVPALVGLPPNLDLDGAGVSEAMALFDELDDLSQAAAFKRPNLNLAGLTISVVPVDLLADIAPPMDWVDESSLSWISVGPDTMLVSLGGGRIAKLREDTIGHHALSVIENGEELFSEKIYEHQMASVVKMAESLIKAKFSSSFAFARPDAPWKKQGATDAQIRLLVKKGVDREYASSLTKGEASSLITAKLSGQILRGRPAPTPRGQL